MASNQDIADMSALIKTLQNRLVDLENTNSTSVAMSPTPPTHAPRDPLFKVDLCLFNGEKPLQAREFHRLAKLIPDMSPGTSEAYLINLVRSRCTEQASYWVDQWVENHKGGTYAELLATFHAQFVATWRCRLCTASNYLGPTNVPVRPSNNFTRTWRRDASGWHNPRPR
jgi:hypothetical protein